MEAMEWGGGVYGGSGLCDNNGIIGVMRKQ